MKTTDNNKELDLDAHYSVKGWRGIAWHCLGYKEEYEAILCYSEDEDGNEIEMESGDFEKVEDRSRVVMVMVGDDRKFTYDRDEIEVLPEDDFCHVCGQIGCCHDGRDRD